MITKRQVLTTAILLEEYVIWTNNHGNGRNDSDLRFGQFIHNNYSFPAQQWNNINNDGYYEEDASVSNNIIHQLIYQPND